MNDLYAVLIGLASGVHTSTWGMYKDAPHEGFTWPKYLRSTVIGVLAALVLNRVLQLDLTLASNVAVFFGATYVGERALLEFWKTFLRVEDQSKYFIPMQFAVLGKVVENRAIQLCVAVVYAATCIFIAYSIWSFQQTGPDLNPLLVVVTIGAAGGWISAFGGAWKDAPKEGFETLKFFRSPLLAAAWAWLLAHFTDNYLLIAACALGYTIATTETYKTFFFPSKPRGKFAGMPISHPEWLQRRYYFVPVYVAVWIGVIVTFVLGFLGRHEGLLA